MVSALKHLVKHFDWICQNRWADLHGAENETTGLFWFEDAGSSGMDNSPRSTRRPTAGQYLSWVDLSCQMALSALCISALADTIGHQDVRGSFKNRWESISRAVEAYLWCPRSGFYHDRLGHARLVLDPDALVLVTPASLPARVRLERVRARP